VTYPGTALVAQVSNLLYRGFPIRKPLDAQMHLALVMSRFGLD